MPVAEAEVGEAVFEAIETRVRSLEAASALATATATEVEWTCFVLLDPALDDKKTCAHSSSESFA